MNRRHMMHPYYNMRPPSQPYIDEEEEKPTQPEQDLPMTEAEAVQDQVDLSMMEPPAEEAQPQEQAITTAAAQELEAAQAELKEERLRMAAEMDNFKKRLTREHQEQMRYASEKVLADLLPALDNLDLAIQYGATHDACKDMLQGVEMTRKQLLDAVGKSGLISVGTRGEEFNPAIHEAIGMESAPDLDKGAVSRVLQRGYKLNDRLLRPAKVMVNN